MKMKLLVVFLFFCVIIAPVVVDGGKNTYMDLKPGFLNDGLNMEESTKSEDSSTTDDSGNTRTSLKV